MTDHPHTADPYFLYAAGNVGSVIGLLAYPIVVEPTLGLARAQRRWWSAGYLLALALCVTCVVLRRRHLARPTAHFAAESRPARAETPPSRVARLRWIALAAVPSGLLLGVTRHLSTEHLPRFHCSGCSRCWPTSAPSWWRSAVAPPPRRSSCGERCC